MSEVEYHANLQKAKSNIKEASNQFYKAYNPLLSRNSLDYKKIFGQFDPTNKHPLIEIVSDEEYQNLYMQEIDSRDQYEGNGRGLEDMRNNFMFVSFPRNDQESKIIFKASEVAKFHTNRFEDQRNNLGVLRSNYFIAVASVLGYKGDTIPPMDPHFGVLKLLNLNSDDPQSLSVLSANLEKDVVVIQRGFEKAIYLKNEDKVRLLDDERLKEITRTVIVTACLEIANRGMGNGNADSMYTTGIGYRDSLDNSREADISSKITKGAYDFIADFVGNEKGRGARFRELFEALTTKSYDDFFTWIFEKFSSKVVTTNNNFHSLLELNKEVQMMMRKV